MYFSIKRGHRVNVYNISTHPPLICAHFIVWVCSGSGGRSTAERTERKIGGKSCLVLICTLAAAVWGDAHTSQSNIDTPTAAGTTAIVEREFEASATRSCTQYQGIQL